MNVEFTKITGDKEPTIKTLEKFRTNFMNRRQTPRGIITSSKSTDCLYRTLKGKYGITSSPSAIECHFKGSYKPVKLWNEMAEDLYLHRKRELEQRQEKAISQKGSSNKRKEKGDSSSKNDEGGNSEDPSDEEHESDDGTESQQKYIRVATTSLRKIIRSEVDYSTVKRLLEETQETNSRVMNTMGTVMSHFVDKACLS
ncbi:hypothetical protein DFQ30_001806 [Apophysomyces sp. BC1015]|nr:hypothetical protein DFQ30_001806 [Apophysomyces sp. BC1015]KAG0166786.1 hypothetical protein DFQ29_000846 [Apophysomyces sp. BC1021]